MTRTSASLHRPTLFRQSSPREPKGWVRLWKRLPHTPPPPRTGKHRAHRGPSPCPGARLDKARTSLGVQQPRLRSQCSRHRPSPLAGDLLISPHILHQAAQDPAHGKSQQGHTKSGNSHHALKGWGKGVEEQRAELRPWQGTVNTPREGPWPSPVAGAVFPVL